MFPTKNRILGHTMLAASMPTKNPMLAACRFLLGDVPVDVPVLRSCLKCLIRAFTQRVREMMNVKFKGSLNCTAISLSLLLPVDGSDQLSRQLLSLRARFFPGLGSLVAAGLFLLGHLGASLWGRIPSFVKNMFLIQHLVHQTTQARFQFGAFNLKRVQLQLTSKLQLEQFKGN